MARLKLSLLSIIAIFLYVSCQPSSHESDLEYVAFKLFSKATEQYLAKNYDEAQVFISRAIELNDRIAQYHELKGDIYAHQNLISKAIDSYSVAKNLRSNNPNLYIKTGHIWYEQKDYDQAIRDYKKAFAQSPKEYWLLFLIVHSYIQKNELTIAENMLNDYYKTMQRDKLSIDRDYYILVSKIYFEQGKLDMIDQNMCKAIELNDLNRNEAVFYLRSLIAVNKTEDAYNLVSNKYKNIVTPGDFHFIRGLYYFKKNNVNDAKVQFELSINSQTEIYEAYTLLNEIYNQIPDLQKAGDVLNKGKKYQDDRLINIGIESLSRVEL